MKKFTTLSFSVLLSCFAFAQVPTQDLVAAYLFNGSARDTSGNGQHGTVVGATLTPNRFNAPNTAYFFNGTLSNYISLPVDSLKNSQYSYSLWAKIAVLPASNNQYMILNIGGSGGDQYINITNNVIPADTFNGFGAGGYNNSAPNQYWGYTGTNADTGVWTHICVTRSSNSMKIFINGNLIKTDSSIGVTMPNYGNNTKAFIGIRNNMSMSFHGAIDDVRIYKRALSNTEVSDLYNESQSTSTKNLNVNQSHTLAYPNPSSGVVYLNNNNGIANTTQYFYLYNAIGGLITAGETSSGNSELNFKEFNLSGIYFLVLKTNNNISEIYKIQFTNQQ